MLYANLRQDQLSPTPFSLSLSHSLSLSPFVEKCMCCVAFFLVFCVVCFSGFVPFSQHTVLSRVQKSRTNIFFLNRQKQFCFPPNSLMKIQNCGGQTKYYISAFLLKLVTTLLNSGWRPDSFFVN